MAKKNKKCDLCGKSFTQAGNSKKHIDAVHNKFIIAPANSSKIWKL